MKGRGGGQGGERIRGRVEGGGGMLYKHSLGNKGGYWWLKILCR